MYYLSEICSLCLASTQNLQSFLSQDTDSTYVEQKLRAFLLELVNFKPNIVKYICSNCLETLNYVYKFRLRCLANIPKLNEYVQKLQIHGAYTNPGTDTRYEKQQQLQQNENIRQTCSKNIETQRNWQQEDIDSNTIYIKEEIEDITDEFLDENSQTEYPNTPDIKFEEQNSSNSNTPQDRSNTSSNVQSSYEVFTELNEEKHIIDENINKSSSTNRINTEAEVKNLLPAKSRAVYEKEYSAFNTWCGDNSVANVTEDVLLAYYEQLSKEKKSSTLWASYSMLRACLNVYKSINISKYERLQAFLKRQADGYQPKKSKILEISDINRFLTEADDQFYLAMKVILIMGYAGGCRRDELTKMLITDIEYKIDTIIVTVPKTESNVPRLFVITEVHWIALIKKYVNLRPQGATTKRFFLTYRNGRCVNSPIGINKISHVPRVIASYLKLPEPEKYTGHCFRRSSVSQVHWIALIKKYVNLRPQGATTKRFFLTYRNGRCVNSPIGINKISHVPRVIATYLKLPEPEKYTGHCFRRSSVSQANQGGELITIKRSGGWKSSAEIAEVLRSSTLIQPSTSYSQQQQQQQQQQQTNQHDDVQSFINALDNSYSKNIQG